MICNQSQIFTPKVHAMFKVVLKWIPNSQLFPRDQMIHLNKYCSKLN